jgi:hypothetical protein
MDELVFPEREVDIDPVPEDAADFCVQQEFAARQVLLTRKVRFGPGQRDRVPQPPDEHFPVAVLGNEIDRAGFDACSPSAPMAQI